MIDDNCILVQDQGHLLAVCDKIKISALVAVDTEFMRDKTYYPILCLIQLNTDNECFIIDVFTKNIDLKPFFLILEDQNIKKIFHSSRQDIEILGGIIKKVPKAIIDTQIMTNFCGFKYNVGYADLVEELLGKKLNKQWQRSDWKKRPLQDGQIKYAMIDVLYLLEIYQILEKRLINEDKLLWFNEEMKYVTKVYTLSDQDLYKKFSFLGKNVVYQENIRSLVLWRNDLAKKHNVPRSFIMKDDLLNKIASNNPQNLAELATYNFSNKGLKNKIMTVLKNKIIDNQNNLFNKKNGKLNLKLSDKQGLYYQKSKTLLQNKAKDYNIRSEFIISQSNLKKIILGLSQVKEILFGWRYEVLGKDLQEVLN